MNTIPNITIKIIERLNYFIFYINYFFSKLKNRFVLERTDRL